MALFSSLGVSLSISETAAVDFSNPAFNLAINRALVLTDGNAAGQANLVWADERVIGSGANDDIDLAGALTRPLGGTLTVATIVGILIINAAIDPNAAANTTNLTIGGGANPITTFLGGTTPTIGPIRPGGMVFLACGAAGGLGAVTAATADILRVANSAGASATYQIVIVGRT